MKRRLLLAFLLAAALLLAGGGTWLLRTPGGFVALCSLAGPLSGGRLVLVPAAGRLLGRFELREARWQAAGQTVEIRNLVLDWSPAALLSRRLEIARLTAASVRLERPPGAPAAPAPAPPASLRLPLDIRIDRIEIGRLESGKEVIAENLAGSLASDGGRLFLRHFQARSGAIDVGGEAEIGSAPPFPLRARLQAGSHWEGHAFQLDVRAGGPLAAIDLEGEARGALHGRLAARLTPFAPQPFSRLQLHLEGIDPAAWLKGAPAARLDVDADFHPRPGDSPAASGSFTIVNRRPGRLDAHALPLTRLSGTLDWQGRRIDFHPLRLAAGEAQVLATGHFSLDPAYGFAAQGELARLDPGRFARLPPGRINARFDVSGHLRPHPAVALRFGLAGSQIRGHPLGGGGDLDLAWPHLRKADLQLVAGPNRLQARGAYGQAGDRLALALDAPRLTPYGIEGGMQGKFDLGGTPNAPTLAGHLQASRLGLPGVGRLRGLALEVRAEAPPEAAPLTDAPLHLELQLDSLDTPTHEGAARQLALHAEGSRGRHTLRAAATLAGAGQFALAATGGLAVNGETPLWSGQLETLALTPPDPNRALRLLRPARLRIGAAEWAVGPAEIGGPQWQGRLLASALDARLHLETSVQSSGSSSFPLASEGGKGVRGKFKARLDARLEGAWKLAPNAPWQGRLDLALPDLAWIGPWLGEGWRTAGQLTGEMQLAGTPAQPLASGRFSGEHLGVRLPEPELRLEDGRLEAILADNRLRLNTLRFDSPLRPPPRELLAARRADPEAAGLSGQLAATPGWLEISGDIDLAALATGSGREDARFDLRLERLGILQQPDQWIALSGRGHLGWQGDTLAAQARLQVDAGYWELAPPGMPHLGSDVAVRTRKAPPAAARPKLDLDIDTDLGPSFYFSGAGLESRLAGSVYVQAAGRDLPRATGSIRTVGGKFDAYGQQLTIERGILNFQGLPDNPGLNVQAFRKGLPVEAGVEVGGTVKKPVVRLISEPELPEAEKLSWLVLGHGSEQTGGNDASTLLAAASTLFGNEGGPSGSPMRQLQRQLGIDFSLRQGQVGDTGTRPATSRIAGGGFEPGAASTGGQIVSVGKRLSSNAQLSYEQALGKAENIVKLTVNLGHRLSLVGRTGSDNALDLFYTFSFGSRRPAP